MAGFKFKSESLGAGESNLLLLFFADTDWSKKDAETNASPGDMLKLIRLCRDQAKLPSPKAFPKFGESMNSDDEAAAKKWLRDNAESYRLERLLRAK